MKKEKREIVFFALVFLFFYLAVKYIDQNSKTKLEDQTILSGGIMFIIAVICIYLLSNLSLHSEEGFWDVSDYAKCKGGPFFWQGDSPTSKMCRELASTPEGRIGISGYNCPTGYVGQPGLPFYYTPLSNAEWKNERCDDKAVPLGIDQGLCSMEKQIPEGEIPQ
jgi:hypothetical protein